ncbi:hypothetical protein L873DRAFT_1788426 [Choiromyces venosus 120613-1]|uniref:PHD-type domain-containing protein n=1 Tax=Choiromyces venosus 120613-1 TaxID=1336337 RepID=A0A3N4JRZ4_9PEZI|nr:hypothetical protein L873DRAFT_1788426 [Choiromyces venosus 120613-1]
MDFPVSVIHFHKAFASSSIKLTSDIDKPGHAQRGRGDFRHENHSRNASFHRNRRSTSRMKKKGGKGNSYAERSNMTDDSRNQGWPGGQQRSVERGRRRQHPRESSRRRRIQHISPHKRSSLDQSRKPERKVEYESNNSIGLFNHREVSGNPQSGGYREKSAARVGSPSEPTMVGLGSWYHDSYEEEKHYDQSISSYAAADHHNTLQYSYGTSISDLDHDRNGNANANQDDTLRGFGAQHTTAVAYQTSNFHPFEHSSSKRHDHPEPYTNTNSNQIRSEFVPRGFNNSYEIPNIPHTSFTVHKHGNASPHSTTSPMSISSGRSPRSVFSNNRPDMNSRKGPICIKCQKPEFSSANLIVRCIRCLDNYHTSCHNPTISVTGGVINIDARDWKCERCTTRLANPSNGFHRQSVPSPRPRPRKKPRLSLNASDTSPSKPSSLSKVSTRMTFSPADHQEEDSTRSKNGHSRNSNSQPSISGDLDSHGARVKESLGSTKTTPQWNSLVTTATPGDREDDFAHRTDDGISSTYPTNIEGQRTSQYNSHDGPSEFDAGVEQRFDGQELTYSDSMSRSANVFSGSRKLAVVIDNRSRSGSVSTNGYQGEGWNQTPPAIQGPRDDVTPIPHSKLRQTLNSPTPQGFLQPSENQPPFLEGNTFHRRKLKRPLSASEIPDSQDEFEGNSTDGPMTLETPESYRHRRNSRQSTNGYRSLSSNNSEQHAQETTDGVLQHERLKRHFNRNDSSNAHSIEKSSHFRLSSTSHRGEEAIKHPTTTRTGVSSPPYSPPPPDAKINSSLLYHHKETAHPAPRPPVARAPSSSADSVVSCRRCRSEMKISDNRRANICSACVRKEHCRGPDLTNTATREPSHNTIPSYHSPPPSCLHPRIDRTNDLRSRHSSTLSATRLPDGRSNGTPSSDSFPSDMSRGCTPQEPLQPEVFRTGKQRVITGKQRVMEKYHMKCSEATNASGLSSQPITETAIRGQKSRKVMELPKPKVTAVAEKLKPAEPPKKNGVSAATSVQAAARVDAPKYINDSALPDTSSAMEQPKRAISMAMMKSISQPKRSARKGPAIKNAGGSINRVLVTDDSSNESDHDGKLRALEKRLRCQKGYTKKQAEKAVELQHKLQESEREKEVLREQLRALSVTINHESNKRPALGNGTSVPEAIHEFLPTQGSPQQELPKKKILKRLVRWEDAHSNRSTPQEDTHTEPGAEDDNPDNGKKTFRYGSMQDFYSGRTFTGEDPWGYPTTTELPEPDPSAFRKPGWRKAAYRLFDQDRLMKVHLHRLTTPNRPPLAVTVRENQSDDDESAIVSNTPAGDKTDKPVNEHRSTRMTRVITFDEFMGLPENIVPSVKDGALGFRSGVIVSIN